MFDQIKSHLLNSIDDIASDANQFVRQPAKDFSRNSPLTMKTMLKSLLALGGKSLAKELLDLDLPSLSLLSFNDVIRLNSKHLKGILEILLLKSPLLTLCQS